MANAFKQVDSIAAEALTVMSDAMVIGNLAMKDVTSDFNKTPDGYAKGDTIRIKTRPDYEVEEFSSTIVVQDIRESKRTLTVEKHFDVSVQITAKEKAMDIDTLVEQVIAPAARRLAEKIDVYMGTKIMEGHGLYASDTLFTTAADMALARKAANYQQLEPGGRYCIVDDTLEAGLIGQTWFNQSQTRGAAGEATLNDGDMGHAMKMNFHGSLAFPTTDFTAGTSICVTNNGAGGNTNNRVGMTTLTVDTQTASKAIKAGDRIQIAGVRRPLLIETAIADTDATTEFELTDQISEIIPDNAAVTVIGSGQAMTFQGAIFDSRSIAAAFPVLDRPSDKPASIVSDNGVSIRVVSGYDMSTKKETLSLDVLCGANAYDPRRITLLSNY